MAFSIEKQISSGWAYHPLNSYESWQIIETKFYSNEAINVLIERTKIEKGNFRVRDNYNGKIIFKISS